MTELSERERQAIEDDPVLTISDVIEYRHKSKEDSDATDQ